MLPRGGALAWLAEGGPREQHVGAGVPTSASRLEGESKMASARARVEGEY